MPQQSLAMLTGWSPPDSFDEYKLLRQLGRGGMGEVYLAHDALLDRLIAIKFISAIEPDEGAREQFLTEARAAARVQHPNVVTIYRVGELENHPFIISEFVRGKGLDTLDRPMPWKRAWELGKNLARGLAAAHRQGVLHRDIKPANVIITDDGVKLLDFGLAKFVARRGEPTWLAPTGPPSVRRDAPTMDLEVVRSGVESGPLSKSPPLPTTATVRPHESKPNPIAIPLVTNTVATTLKAADFTQPSVLTPLLRDLDDELAPISSVTPLSTVKGTPHYMAPELWRGEPATRRSDVYSLGVVLFELCAGDPPHLGTPLHDLGRRTLEEDAPLLADVARTVDPRFAAIVDRCLRRDPNERFDSGDELREALEQISPTTRRHAIPQGNPYRGLLPFEAEHRALFFGRSNEVGLVLERLRAESFVLIAGDSGVGKSSLCRAGVLPLISEGVLGEGRVWQTTHFTPGKHPLGALVSSLVGLLEIDEESLATKLGADPTALGRELRKRLGEGRGIVLFVDQLEELITLGEEDQTRAVGEALKHLASRLPGVRLLMTVRSDFLARVASVPGLGDELSRGLYLLRPLSPDKIREAIIGPARAKGVSFESEELVEKLVASTDRAEGLPLLQFALSELWKARTDSKSTITAEALESIGGVAGALARHADNVLLGLPMDQRAEARRILVALVTLDGTRAQRTETELSSSAEAAHAALEALVRGRLIVAHETESGTAYEIAHEALLKGWDTLRRWIDQQGESRVVKQRLETAVAEWERLGRTREALWSPRHMAEAEVVDPDELAQRERAFLAASRRAIRGNRIRKTGMVIAVPLIVGLVYSAIQMKEARDINRKVTTQLNEAKAVYAEAQAKNAEVEELRKKAFAEFDAQKRDEGESLWARALSLAAEVDRTYGHASQTLEAALSKDATREDVREMLANVLYERALMAERDRRTAQRDDLLERLTLYDTNGERRRRWTAPAQLTIKTTPAGAHVIMEEYVDDKRQKRFLTNRRDLGQAPVMDIEVSQGSYLLTLSIDGRIDVRYPILLGRGEHINVAVEIPPTSAVPEGFVYIPAGRFLFGTSADEMPRRGFMNAAPIHEATTDSYLIARNETTYGDWLDYLRALPQEERSRRTPKVGEGVAGTLELRELPPDGWMLTFQPTTQTYTVKLGEKVIYRSRKVRAEQNWLRFPVSGISHHDAMAYASWLHTTGRVPKARVCTEHEWERAAKGADDREFPHGDRLDPDDANVDRTYGSDSASWGPDEIGSHPISQSPFGVDDMTGNIIEWTTLSLTSDISVARGGAYYYGDMTARSTNREVVDPNLRDPRVGLRVCASFP